MPSISFREKNFIHALKKNDLSLVENILKENSDGLPYHIVELNHLPAWEIYIALDCISPLQKQKGIIDTIEKGMIEFVVTALPHMSENDIMTLCINNKQQKLLQHLIEKENFYPYFYNFHLLEYAEETDNADALIYLVSLAKDTVPETYHEIKEKYTTGVIANVISGIEIAEQLRSMPYSKSKHTAQNKI